MTTFGSVLDLERHVAQHLGSEPHVFGAHFRDRLKEVKTSFAKEAQVDITVVRHMSPAQVLPKVTAKRFFQVLEWFNTTPKRPKHLPPFPTS